MRTRPTARPAFPQETAGAGAWWSRERGTGTLACWYSRGVSHTRAEARPPPSVTTTNKLQPFGHRRGEKHRRVRYCTVSCRPDPCESPALPNANPCPMLPSGVQSKGRRLGRRKKWQMSRTPDLLRLLPEMHQPGTCLERSNRNEVHPDVDGHEGRV